mmetsp:Transcript_22682/g.71030  ORF Transcript_22682/g.71030 Transcript_22682/m.71030 type:complete len:229 (-) Transcript_22682:1549-2235(-)
MNTSTISLNLLLVGGHRSCGWRSRWRRVRPLAPSKHPRRSSNRRMSESSARVPRRFARRCRCQSCKMELNLGRDVLVEDQQEVTDGFVTGRLSGTLTSINVWGCSNLTDASIKAIAARCPLLKSLDVSFCKKLTDESIKEIAARCSWLESLNVASCGELTDESIRAIAVGCRSLEALNVGSCRKLTDESIKALAASCSFLKKFEARYCNFTALPCSPSRSSSSKTSEN